MPGLHLLIDGRNCAYRSIYANQDHKYHSFVVMLRFIKGWINQFKPSEVHIFWDAPRHTVWRRQILEEYKERDTHKQLPGRNVVDELAAVQAAARDLFNVMNVRQYSRKSQEADDLIYAACRNLYPQEVIVVSSDGDFTQIPYYMPNAKLWEPRKGKWVETPKFNPVIQKCLAGDNSDKIDGYDGIGPVHSTRMAGDAKELSEFLAKNERVTYLRNMMLIDLALCPHLLANQMYVAKKLVTPIQFDKKEIIRLMGVHKLNGLFQEYEKICLPFRDLCRPETVDVEKLEAVTV